MRVIHSEHLYQLTLFPRLFPVNCYFVEEQEGLTLIDAALGLAAKDILQAAARIGKPIIRILLTHAHDDHVGALDAVKAAFPQAPLLMSARDAQIMNGDKSLLPHEDQTPIKGGVSEKVKTRPDGTLQEGDMAGSLRVMETPGHTPGSLSFLDIRTNTLIVGDALQTRGGLAVAGQVRPLFPFPAWGTWSKTTALQSAQKIAELQPAVLAVGHGELLRAPALEIKQAIARG
ncbi:MBL fold metallo-hydrolase [Ectobacillus ponti]|uniref:MBL fold metallo-hydrolase n=1 Tax=Ectobacillus ponti TaxID=2961894 RepID=A0AA42BRR4_9BACI|nr:MBL fold metallo-hydrolase [Ectobacillus ponti]MCP8967633.1 MBL fold metallo-hydrolase [Ectobacillus ponti]